MKPGIITGVALLLATGVTVAAAQEQRWQPIAYGETLAGFLTVGDDSLQDGSLFKLFLFEGQEGDSITIQINSEDFNAHVLFANEQDDVLATAQRFEIEVTPADFFEHSGGPRAEPEKAA